MSALLPAMTPLSASNTGVHVLFSREQRAVGGGSVELCSTEGGRERPPLNRGGK
jgi:hypothetical protein